MIAQGDACKFYIDDYKLICRAWRNYHTYNEKKYEVTVKKRKHGKWIQIYHTFFGPMIDTYFTADKFISDLIEVNDESSN